MSFFLGHLVLINIGLTPLKIKPVKILGRGSLQSIESRIDWLCEIPYYITLNWEIFRLVLDWFYVHILYCIDRFLSIQATFISSQTLTDIDLLPRILAFVLLDVCIIIIWMVFDSVEIGTHSFEPQVSYFRLYYCELYTIKENVNVQKARNENKSH